MATDAEINLKVNVPPPKTDAIEKLLKDVQRIKGFTESYIKEASKGSDIAEAAKIGRERAAKLGEEMAKKYEAGFADGFKNVLKFGARQAQLTKGVAAVSQDITGAEAAWREGKLTDTQMLGLAEKKYAQMFTLYENAGDLKNTVAASEQDLNRNNQLEELLALNEKFNEQLVNEAEGARAFARELKNAAGALEDEVEALDLSVPGNEKLKLTLLEQAKSLRARSNAAEKAAEVIEHEADVINRSIQAFDGTEKAFAKSQKEVEAATARALAQKKKLAELGAQQDVANQRQIVNEEKLAEQQRRREAAEEKRAAADAKRAKQDELLREKDLFQTSLLGKTKLELAKMLREVNKERVAASKIDDKEALDRLTMQYGVLRSAMRQAGMQANITRMMFMQQAQTATSMAANLETLTNGLGSFSTAAKNGELNLSGLATAATSLWLSFKAGIGPIGAITLGLHALQSVINSHIKENKKLKELEQQNTEIINAESDAVWALKRARDEVNNQRKRDNAVITLKAEYDNLNKTLQSGLDLINAQTSAELRRQQLTQDDAQFQRTLRKHELGRALTEGKMSRAEYDLALLAMSEEEAIAGADASVSAAETKAEAARKKTKNADDTRKEIRRKQENLYSSLKYQKISAHEWEAYEREEQRLLEEEKKAEEEWKKLSDQAESEGIFIGLSAAGALEGISFGAYEGPTQMWEKKIKQASANLDAARNARLGLKKSMRKKLGKSGSDIALDKGSYLAEQKKEQAMLDAAEKAAAEAQAAVRAAHEEEKNAENELRVAKDNAERTKKQAKDMRESQEKNLQTEIKENKKAEKRQKKINKDLEDLQKKDLKELDDLKQGFEGKRGKTGGSKRWEQYTEAARLVQEEIDRRNKGAAEVAERMEIEGMNDRAFGRGGKGLSAVNLEGIRATMSDNMLTAAELSYLVKEMEKARKAQNETAQQLIQVVVQNALETRKTAEKERRRINELKREGAL